LMLTTRSRKQIFSMILRPHQQRIIDENPNRALLVHEMRTGKSLIAKRWSENPARNKNAIIVCLKANKKEWVALCPDATVYTKEEFKKHVASIKDPTAVVVDEAHNFASPLFIASKRSQLSEALYSLIKKNPDMHILLLTATPLTNDPASLHTLMAYLGNYVDWKVYQRQFYELLYKPFLPRAAWFPRNGWRREANALLTKYADIVSLADCVDYLPPVIEEVITIKTPKRSYADDEEYHWTKDHIQEQSLKGKEIKRIAEGHRKLIVVCHYTEQIDALKKSLEKVRPVFVLDGRTKDQSKTIKEAQASEDCFFIVQAKIGLGWDGYMFGALVFASIAHRVIDHTQMRGRLTSVDYPKPCVYYYLIGGRWDRLIYNSVMAGENFNPHKYDKTTRPTP